jgi:hypothetical protein
MQSTANKKVIPLAVGWWRDRQAKTKVVPEGLPGTESSNLANPNFESMTSGIHHI